jgi:hypothetical protein
MRARKTFTDRSTFDIRSAGETLFFGPKTAAAVSVVAAVHADMLADSERAGMELSWRIRQLRGQGVTRQDAIATVRATDPELWERTWPRLDRTGVTTIRNAALADTKAILDALYSGRTPSFVPCHTPLDALRRYSHEIAA